MLTRRMNVRITIFKREGGQNEDGEVLDNVRTDIMSCWAEVSRRLLKIFVRIRRANKQIMQR